jgi:hypothetical protein
MGVVGGWGNVWDVRKAERKIVYTVKYIAAGEVDKFKARLVAMKYSQRPGIDYLLTYAEVPRTKTLLAFLATVATEDLVLQADVKTAFLHGELVETLSVYSLHSNRPERGNLLGPASGLCGGRGCSGLSTAELPVWGEAGAKGLAREKE